LAQVAEFAFENFGAPEWVLKTFVVVLLLGMPLALFFAWAFELTPEGLKREVEVDRTSSITPQTGRKLDRLIIAGLVIAVVYFAWNSQREPVPAEAPAAETAVVADIGPDARSIAVLPFVNMSSDEEQEWFADGLTEELLNSLARMPDLLVAARTSSFGYKGSTDSIPNIAKALGVAHVLEGSVRRGNDRLRITAQLIRAADGFHLWSETYDRSPDDVIAIQEDLAIEIARALETAMDPEALEEMVSAGTASVPAYEAYLKGLALITRANATGDANAGDESLEKFEEATRIDPKFSSAYAQQSIFWRTELGVNNIGTGDTGLQFSEIMSRYKQAISQAIANERDLVRVALYKANEAVVDLRIRDADALLNGYLVERPNDADVLETYPSRSSGLLPYSCSRAITRRPAMLPERHSGASPTTRLCSTRRIAHYCGMANTTRRVDCCPCWRSRNYRPTTTISPRSGRCARWAMNSRLDARFARWSWSSVTVT